MPRVSIGPISVLAPEQWTFVPFEDIILARTHSRLGVLQISLAYRQGAPAGSGHEHCLGIALGFVDAGSEELVDRESSGNGECLFGAASFRRSDQMNRVFYTRGSDGLLVAAYQSVHAGADSEVAECAEILRSATFDPSAPSAD